MRENIDLKNAEYEHFLRNVQFSKQLLLQFWKNQEKITIEDSFLNRITYLNLVNNELVHIFFIKISSLFRIGELWLLHW